MANRRKDEHPREASPLSATRVLFAIALFAAAAFGVLAVVRYLARQPQAEQPLEVRTLLREVKKQLAEAQMDAIANKEDPLFQLKSFDMEVNFVARNDGSAKLEVLGVGTNLGVGTERVQKLQLHWDAVPPRTASAAASSVSGGSDVVIQRNLP